MAGHATMRCGEFRTSYRADTTIFPTPMSRNFALGGVVLLVLAPLVLNAYYLNLLIQIGYYGIAALGLNILVGFTGQISLGHAGVLTTAVGMIVGVPAGRIKGLYLAIATLASQFILEDFFARAEWFTGGSSGSLANSISLFGYPMNSEQSYFYVVLFFVVVMFLFGANLLRTRDGRAFVAVRDHYLSAEIMGINLTKYRILSFGISSFYAGIGGALYGHYLGFVSAEGFTILLSIQFLGMVIIGGLGSVMGALLGTTFMVLLPEVMTSLVRTAGDMLPGLSQGVAYIKQMAIGLAIILFLIFEPDGLAHRWKMIKAYWKLYPFSY
jgi:branched-chain amino acid transport system permease protein